MTASVASIEEAFRPTAYRTALHGPDMWRRRLERSDAHRTERSGHRTRRIGAIGREPNVAPEARWTPSKARGMGWEQIQMVLTHVHSFQERLVLEPTKRRLTKDGLVIAVAPSNRRPPRVVYIIGGHVWIYKMRQKPCAKRSLIPHGLCDPSKNP